MKQQRIPTWQYASLLLLLLALSFTTTFGQQSNWTGAVSTDWHDADNWNPVGEPGPMDDVVIMVTPNDPIIDGMASINSVDVQLNASLTIMMTGHLKTNGGGGGLSAGINQRGFLNNEGQISCDGNNDQSGFGIFIGSTGIFLNYGSIEIGVTNALNNEGLFNLGTFTNEVDGSITVAGVGNNGISNGSSSTLNNAIFYNKGLISIPPNSIIPNYGLTNSSQFINENTGIIEIENIKALLNEGDFINRNVMNITGTNVRGFRNSSFSNDNSNLAEFTNEACAIIFYKGRVRNDDIIVNNGFFIAAFNSLPINNGTIINNGGFASNIYVYITNNEMLIEPRIGTCGAITDAFNLGAPLDFNVLGVFTDDEATLSAGTYDVNTNTFSPTIGGGDYILFVKIEDSDNGCEAIFPWEITIESPLDAVCLNTSVTFNGESQLLVAPDELLDASNSTGSCGMVIQTAPTTDIVVDCSSIGTTIDVTVTVSDDYGNSDHCTASIAVEGLPCGFSDTGGLGGCGSSNSSVFNPNTGSFTLSSDECAPAFPYTDDQSAFMGIELCGDGEIIAHVTNIVGTGFAGVMLRESYDPGAPMVSIGTNRINRVRKQIRVLPGYPAWPQAVLAYDQYWVRAVRTGNLFQAYASNDGVNWFLYIQQQVFMSDNCIVAGLYTYSEKAGTPITATFDNVSVTGAALPVVGPPDIFLQREQLPAVPALSAFPNPANDVLHISMAEMPGQSVDLLVFNSVGQQILRQSIAEPGASTQTLDVSTLDPGLYTLCIKRRDKYESLKFIIAR